VKDKNALPIMEENDVFKLTVRYEKEGAYSNSNSDKIINLTSGIKHGDEILELIQVNPKITAAEMALELFLSERHTRKIISRLVELKLIERKGSDKVGEWTIIK
jgi:ATP-dependent DNA helicase RecG